jgi:eukaryotic-like serine/threonine-protein kinase
VTSTASAIECPRCRAPLRGSAYCKRDGTLVADSFVIGERYAANELIGAGGFAFVFGGHHLVLGKPVAIKLLRGNDALSSRRFLREARTSSQLGHENIVSILDFGTDTAAGAFLVMERFTSTTLAEVIRSSAPVPVARAIAILLQLARALGAAHSAGVLHRDVTPKNVLVGKADHVKLCDFGLARSLADADRVTREGSLVGTPAYMAPEQIRGDDEIDERADIYGFGCTAYEMLSGQVPHEGTSPVSLFARRLNDETVDALRDGERALPPALEDLVMRCLHSDPAERPLAAELEVQLAAIAAGGRQRPVKPDVEPERIGGYDVVRLLGRGGASSVYLGRHSVIGTRAAIKVLHAEVAAVTGMAERFIQEARASSELGSPHIPRYFDFGYLDTGQPFAVMEYLDGESLGARIARDEPIGVELTAEIVGQVARAMADVHAKGIIHRDLKPDNLFLTYGPDGRPLVKILDFGIAKAISPDASAAQTGIGLMLGTPYYCAPEQALGLAIGPACDIYALGATAFEMLAGRPPFLGAVVRVLGAKSTSAAPPLRGLIPAAPEAVARTIDRMLALEPEGRQASMRGVADEIAAWPRAELSSGGRAIAAPGSASATGDVARWTDGELAVAGESRWRGWWWKLAVALAGVGLGIALVVASGGDDAARSPTPERRAPAPARGSGAAPIAPSSPPPAPAAEPSRPGAPASEPVVDPPAATDGPPTRQRPTRRKPPAKASPAPSRTTNAERRDDAVIVDPYED